MKWAKLNIFPTTHTQHKFIFYSFDSVAGSHPAVSSTRFSASSNTHMQLAAAVSSFHPSIHPPTFIFLPVFSFLIFIFNLVCESSRADGQKNQRQFIFFCFVFDALHFWCKWKSTVCLTSKLIDNLLWHILIAACHAILRKAVLLIVNRSTVKSSTALKNESQPKSK